MLQEIAELGGFTTMTMEEIQEVNGGCSTTVVGVGVYETIITSNLYDEDLIDTGPIISVPFC